MPPAPLRPDERRPYVRRRTDYLTAARRRLPFARVIHHWNCRDLVILWRLGRSTATTMFSLIHVLLMIAVIVVLLRMIGCRGAL